MQVPRLNYLRRANGAIGTKALGEMCLGNLILSRTTACPKSELIKVELGIISAATRYEPVSLKPCLLSFGTVVTALVLLKTVQMAMARVTSSMTCPHHRPSVYAMNKIHKIHKILMIPPIRAIRTTKHQSYHTLMERNSTTTLLNRVLHPTVVPAPGSKSWEHSSSTSIPGRLCSLPSSVPEKEIA